MKTFFVYYGQPWDDFETLNDAREHVQRTGKPMVARVDHWFWFVGANGNSNKVLPCVHPVMPWTREEF